LCMFQTLTNWMIVLVTVDRYCCVCRPLDAPRCFTHAARRRYVVVIFAAAFLYNLPRSQPLVQIELTRFYVTQWRSHTSGVRGVHTPVRKYIIFSGI